MAIVPSCWEQDCQNGEIAEIKYAVPRLPVGVECGLEVNTYRIYTGGFFDKE